MTRHVRASILLLGASLVLATDAGAGTDTGLLSVTATVESSCALDGGTLSFGTYLSGQNGNLDAAGSISYVNCPPGTITFELDGGFSGDIANRVMLNGGSELKYQLYRDPARAAVFGTGANSQSVLLLGPGTLSSTLPVYGRIPGNQGVAAGAYSDTVNVTLTF